MWIKWFLSGGQNDSLLFLLFLIRSAQNMYNFSITVVQASLKLLKIKISIQSLDSALTKVLGFSES